MGTHLNENACQVIDIEVDDWENILVNLYISISYSGEQKL